MATQRPKPSAAQKRNFGGDRRWAQPRPNRPPVPHCEGQDGPRATYAHNSRPPTLVCGEIEYDDEAYGLLFDGDRYLFGGCQDNHVFQYSLLLKYLHQFDVNFLCVPKGDDDYFQIWPKLAGRSDDGKNNMRCDTMEKAMEEIKQVYDTNNYRGNSGMRTLSFDPFVSEEVWADGVFVDSVHRLAWS